MARISAVNMRLIIDDVFASPSGSGYVLDFSNRTFAEFFKDEFGIDIDAVRYHTNGSSKANRLRSFLQLELESTAARVLRGLWKYREDVNGPLDRADAKAVHQETRFFQVVHALDGKGIPARPDLTKPEPNFVSPPRQSLGHMNDRLLTLTLMQPQERGFAFEKFLSELFALYKLDPRNSFRLTGEQIDGSFELPPETFLVEAKWQASLTGLGDLLTFSSKVERKAQWSRGLFISYSGFSPDGLVAFARGKPTSIVCFDGGDLSQILMGGLNLVEVIQKKKRRAAETGNAFVPVRDLFMSAS